MATTTVKGQENEGVQSSDNKGGLGFFVAIKLKCVLRHG